MGGGEWGQMGKNTGKMGHNACNFISLQHLWALLPLFCLWLTKCTPLGCAVYPHQGHQAGVRVCKIFATWVDN